MAPSEVDSDEKDIGLRLDKTRDIAGEDSLDIQSIDIRADREEVGGHAPVLDDTVKMHVKYCIGWSYRGTLVQIQQHVQARLAQQRANLDIDDADTIPKVEITGDNYEVGGLKRNMADAIGYVRTAFFILLFVGESFFTPFGGLR